MKFALSDMPLVAEPFTMASAGGFVSFEGKVRNHANGRAVVSLEYEAYADLAISEGETLVSEAIEKFGLTDATVIHRTGLLQIGETAVLIQVAAAHRREAFAGCEWILDQLKHRVPIWKKEHFADGDSGWIGTDPPRPNHALSECLTRRQKVLEEVGEAGQLSLGLAKVLLIGAGGLACGCLPYLVGAGVGTIGLVDSDEVDLTNLHRQILYTTGDVGRLKVDRAANFASRLNPDVAIHVHPVKLTTANAETLVRAYDWVVDGTDSLQTKFILNDVCQRQRKHLVTASVHRFEGQIMTIAPDGPCLRCLFPKEPPPHCVSNCAETGVLGIVPGLFGILQANEVLKGILGYGELLTHQILLFDLRTGASQFLARPYGVDCPRCSGIGDVGSDWEVATLDEAAARFGTFRLIDIRELDELPSLRVSHERLPMSEYSAGDSAEAIVFVCAKGIRSFQLVARLRAQGYERVASLRGGLEACGGVLLNVEPS